MTTICMPHLYLSSVLDNGDNVDIFCHSASDDRDTGEMAQAKSAPVAAPAAATAATRAHTPKRPRTSPTSIAQTRPRPELRPQRRPRTSPPCVDGPSVDVIDDDSVHPGIKPHGHRRPQAMPATYLLAWPNASAGGVLGRHSNLLELHPADVIVVTDRQTHNRHRPKLKAVLADS